LDLAEKINLPPDLRSISKYNSKRGTADKVGLNGSITNRCGKMGKGDIITVIDGHRIAGNEEKIS
jgi:hypothetical protein